MPDQQDKYKIIHKIVSQPLDHAKPEGASFNQHIDILIPEEANNSSPVFFHLGNEQALDEEKLVLLYEAYGKRNDVIFLHAEHRGYGKSISSDNDQTIPNYVRINQVLDDYHYIVQTLKENYNGPWIGAGYSYGGGLVINFAYKYPMDVSVILSSSGVVNWPFVMDTYDHQMRINYGENLYSGIAKHINSLKPQALFDNIWLEREFLIAACHGLAQREQLKGFRTSFKKMVELPTIKLLEQLHQLDNEVAEGEGWNYALSNAKLTLNREEALTGKYSWRVWRYQQCMETGVFEISENLNGVFPRTYEDFIKEGIALFSEEPPASKKSEWSPRSMVKHLKTPLIYVCGGMDPWKGLCLEPEYKIKMGYYFYYPEGHHCPEKDKIRRGKEVIETLLKYVKKK
jgi:pimeloyl-ACP methyl ester carboxylesterase